MRGCPGNSRLLRRSQAGGIDVEVVKVQGDLERDDAARQAVRHDQERENLQGGEPGLRDRRQRPPDDDANLRIAPPGARPEDDAGPPGPPPLGGRVQGHRACGAQAEQDDFAERHAGEAGACAVDQGRRGQDGHDAKALDRRRGGGQGEALA